MMSNKLEEKIDSFITSVFEFTVKYSPIPNFIAAKVLIIDHRVDKTMIKDFRKVTDTKRWHKILDIVEKELKKENDK